MFFCFFCLVRFRFVALRCMLLLLLLLPYPVFYSSVSVFAFDGSLLETLYVALLFIVDFLHPPLFVFIAHLHSIFWLRIIRNVSLLRWFLFGVCVLCLAGAFCFQFQIRCCCCFVRLLVGPFVLHSTHCSLVVYGVYILRSFRARFTL